MGCLFHKAKVVRNSKEYEVKKEYSWDKRSALNVSDFTIENLEDCEKWKLPGSVNGQQMVVKNCKNTTIYIMDYINTITIDDCIGCILVMGPVKGSVFLRDCQDCVCLFACGQFRIRDCHNLVLFLHCMTQPIIESSSSILFGCYQLYYSGIREHFMQASLSIFNNLWSKVHDFTPSNGDKNWEMLPENTTPFKYMPLIGDTSFGLSLSLIDSIVPYTTHSKLSDEAEYCFVVFFYNNGNEELSASDLINKIYTQMVECSLIWSKQIQLESQEASEVFLAEKYSEMVKNGALIALLFSGSGIMEFCKEKTEVDSSVAKHMYISTNHKTLRKQIDAFLSIAKMHDAF